MGLGLVWILAAAAGGCGYTVSSALPSHLKTLSIPVLVNNTVEFGLADDITQSLVNGFLADRHLRIVQERDADAVLRGAVAAYKNQVFGYTSTERATEYEIVLTVQVTFRDMIKNREVWKEDALTVRTTYNVVPVGSEPARTEADGRREVVEKLTDQIVSRTVQGW
ncbi:MAG TPA: LptE family protein [Candidatus Eisenbacteria bacterium]|jgi:outer membrane lipopolysaccharide assembly protein LptE/RlpB